MAIYYAHDRMISQWLLINDKQKWYVHNLPESMLISLKRLETTAPHCRMSLQRHVTPLWQIVFYKGVTRSITAQSQATLDYPRLQIFQRRCSNGSMRLYTIWKSRILVKMSCPWTITNCPAHRCTRGTYYTLCKAALVVNPELTPPATITLRTAGHAYSRPQFGSSDGEEQSIARRSATTINHLLNDVPRCRKTTTTTLGLKSHKIPELVYRERKPFLFRLVLTCYNHKRFSLLLHTCPWMDQWVFCPLFSLWSHHAVWMMLGYALQSLHANLNYCTVRGAPNCLKVSLASLCLLSVRACTRLDVMIARRVCGHCARTAPLFTTPIDEAMQSGISTTAGCSQILQFADEALPSLSGCQYVDYGSGMTSKLRCFLASLISNVPHIGRVDCAPLH